MTIALQSSPAEYLAREHFRQSVFFLNTFLDCPVNFFLDGYVPHAAPYVVSAHATQISSNSNHGTHKIRYFLVYLPFIKRGDKSLRRVCSEKKMSTSGLGTSQPVGAIWGKDPGGGLYFYYAGSAQMNGWVGTFSTQAHHGIVIHLSAYSRRTEHVSL